MVDDSGKGYVEGPVEKLEMLFENGGPSLGKERNAGASRTRCRLNGTPNAGREREGEDGTGPNLLSSVKCGQAHAGSKTNLGRVVGSCNCRGGQTPQDLEKRTIYHL